MFNTILRAVLFTVTRRVTNDIYNKATKKTNNLRNPNKKPVRLRPVKEKR